MDPRKGLQMGKGQPQSIECSEREGKREEEEGSEFEQETNLHVGYGERRWILTGSGLKGVAKNQTFGKI